MQKRALLMVPAAALLAGGAAFAAPTTRQTTHASWNVVAAQTQKHVKANGETGRNAGEMMRLNGVIVDYLSYVTRSGTRGPLLTGTNVTGVNGNGNANGGGASGGANAGASAGTNGGGASAGGNAGANGGSSTNAAEGTNGGGSTGVSNNSGSNVGSNNGGNGGVLRPLGFLANGKLYIIDLPAQHTALANVLSRNMGREIALMGHTFTRNGATVFVVDAVE